MQQQCFQLCAAEEVNVTLLLQCMLGSTLQHRQFCFFPYSHSQVLHLQWEPVVFSFIFLFVAVVAYSPAVYLQIALWLLLNLVIISLGCIMGHL